MRRLAVLGAVSAAALLAGCSGATGSSDGSQAASSSRPSAPSSSAPRLPAEPKPAVEQPCPYLGTDFVADANGQHVGTVRTSQDTPHPTCFFYRPDGDVQLTVRVYVGDPAVAKRLVDKAAPIATSNPTSQPAGWEGGYEATDTGSVYAVAKAGDAVIVTSNQQQSVKARTVATEAISSLEI